MIKKYLTKSAKESQKLGENFALRFYSGQAKNKNRKGALVLGLNGDLGSGKTTFLQGFAKGLGIKEKILSPTFVIMKKFQIPRPKGYPELQTNTKYKIQNTKYFYHIDCYRINKPEEILELGFKEIISNPKNIVAIEWFQKIKKVLTKSAIFVKFNFVDKNTRAIDIEM